MNLNIKINLLALENVAIIPIQGSSKTKKCVVIPIEDNDIYMSMDEELKPKSAYLSAIAWESKEVGKYGDTHRICQSFSKEYRERVGEEELKKKPILGNGKPVQKKEQGVVKTEAKTPDVKVSEDDLPF